MTVDFSTQFSLLKEIIAEYRDCCYQGIIDYQRLPLPRRMPPSSGSIRPCPGEEDRFVEVKELLEYEKFEELMKNRP